MKVYTHPEKLLQQHYFIFCHDDHKLHSRNTSSHYQECRRACKMIDWPKQKLTGLTFLSDGICVNTLLFHWKTAIQWSVFSKPACSIQVEGSASGIFISATLLNDI